MSLFLVFIFWKGTNEAIHSFIESRTDPSNLLHGVVLLFIAQHICSAVDLPDLRLPVDLADTSGAPPRSSRKSTGGTVNLGEFLNWSGKLRPPSPRELR